MPITHAFTSAKSDGGDATLVKPSDWNAAHTGIQYPSLKPATPTDDFAAASLDAAWSAHSRSGTFVTGNCMTQGEDWLGSSLEMQFSSQSGTIYRTHADADFDFTVGGIRHKGISTASSSVMFGIAALNTSGTGVGIVIYNDGSMYIASITTYAYGAQSDIWSGHGQPQVTGQNVAGDWWVRLKRVGSTWTGYGSNSGRAWDKTFSTRSDSIVVAQLHFGILYDNGSNFSGRLMADYYQLDV